MIIDSTDEIIGIDDVITIKEIYDINFTLKDKLVIDEKNKKIVGGWEFYYTTTPNSATVLEKFRRHRTTYSSFSDYKSNRR